MLANDYTGLKKKRELEIVRMIYPETENSIKDDHEENPDFLLYNFLKKFVFGIEVTELYRNQSSARLKKIGGYVDDLVNKGQYRHKDDFNELKVDDFDVLNDDGTIKSTFRGVFQNLPSISEFLQLLENCIAQKESKLLHYATEAKFHNLLIYETEDYFASVKVEDFYSTVFFDNIQELLRNTGFREIYFIGKIESEIKFIPMKGYLLYAYAGQYENFYQKVIGTEISVLNYANLFISILSRCGFKKAIIHHAESFISISHGDFSIRIDLLNPSGNLLLLNRDLDYSDGTDVNSYSSQYFSDEAIVRQFKKYQNENSFHTNASFPVN